MLTTDWEPDERVLTATEPRLEVGYLDGRPVTAAARTVAHGLVHLLLGATLPEARHLGCWAAIVRSRLVDQPELPPSRCSATMAGRAPGGCSASCPSAGSPTGFDRGREQPAIVVPCGKPRPAGGQPPGPKRPNSPPINVAMRSLRHRTQIWWLGSELL